MKPLIIFGIGQIAEVAHYYFSEDSSYEVAGFTVDDAYLDRSELFGLPAVAFENATEQFPPGEFDFFAAVGYDKMNSVRREKVKLAQTAGYDIAHYVSSRAFVWKDFEPRPNLFLLEDNTIQPHAKIGENVTLWSGNHIGHHAVICDDVFLCSHVVVSGAARIGRGSFLGVNATVGDNITIGVENVIGAGALVLKDTADQAVFPAKQTEKSKVPSNRLRSL
ncbi:MAG: transferase [Rhodospirillaceae bacterium]|nr:transferase [Rhodospirillaceae bacterium]